MYDVTLQVWLVHADFPPEQVPDRYVSTVLGKLKAGQTILEREIELPFPPYPGLVLWLGQADDRAVDEAQVDKVFYSAANKHFLCEVHPRIHQGASFEEVVKAYLQCGWNWQED